MSYLALLETQGGDTPFSVQNSSFGIRVLGFQLEVIFTGSCGVPDNQAIHTEQWVPGLGEEYGDAYEDAYHDQDDDDEQEEAEQALAAA